MQVLGVAVLNFVKGRDSESTDKLWAATIKAGLTAGDDYGWAQLFHQACDVVLCLSDIVEQFKTLRDQLQHSGQDITLQTSSVMQEARQQIIDYEMQRKLFRKMRVCDDCFLVCLIAWLFNSFHVCGEISCLRTDEYKLLKLLLDGDRGGDPVLTCLEVCVYPLVTKKFLLQDGQ